jgi:hypothetical protein
MLAVADALDAQDWTGLPKPAIKLHGQPEDESHPILLWDIRFSPSWVIDSGRCQIIATWADIQPPVIAEGPAPTFGPDRDFFTLLFFADSATITCNGLPVKGQTYQRDIWQASIGGNRSSCVFALAETMIMVRN